jgi:poly-beta-1,6-N-acetyl-D-glucosamine synthase
MMPWWVLLIFVLGANFALWGTVGLVRLAESLAGRYRPGRVRTADLAGPGLAGRGLAGPGQGGTVMAVTADAGPDGRALSLRPPASQPLTTRDVAVLIPAHNEALVLEESLRSIMALVPRDNVHVVSDGSTDATVEIARRSGARVIETQENVGKAGALEEAIGRFDLISRFPVVMLLDADTRVEPGYFTAALPIFENPQVVAVAGCVRTEQDRSMTLEGKVLVGHRTRIYAIGQRALKFGQTWLRVNATPIVPGFASLYRAEVLPHIEMNPPGLVIEDFNMTFEVYQKGLGKVGFSLRAVAITQDPDNLRDYVHQTKRWAIGLWQTVRRHPPQANLFTGMVTLLLIELVTSSLLFFLLPLALIVLAVPDLAGSALSWPGFSEVHAVVAAHLTLTAVLFGVVLPDYLLTCVVAVLERQPRLLLLGVFFPFMRMLDACIGLYAIPAAWLSRSSGRWKSPARRVVDTEDAPAVPSAVADQPAVRARPAPGLAAARAGLGPGGAGRVPVRDESSTGSTGAGPTPRSPARVAEASHVSG